MKILERILEQMYNYHKATDIPLQLLDVHENVIQAFSERFSYCQITKEACGERAFWQGLLHWNIRTLRWWIISFSSAGVP